MKRLVATLSALALTLVVAPAAHAAFPGANGDIVFQRKSDPWLLDPGTGETTRLARTRAREGLFDWNATGTPRSKRNASRSNVTHGTIGAAATRRHDRQWHTMLASGLDVAT